MIYAKKKPPASNWLRGHDGAFLTVFTILLSKPRAFPRAAGEHTIFHYGDLFCFSPLRWANVAGNEQGQIPTYTSGWSLEPNGESFRQQSPPYGSETVATFRVSSHNCSRKASALKLTFIARAIREQETRVIYHDRPSQSFVSKLNLRNLLLLFQF